MLTVYIATLTAAVVFLWAVSRPPVVYGDPVWEDSPVGCPGDHFRYSQGGFIRYSGAMIIDTDIKRMVNGVGDHVTGSSRSFRLPVRRGLIDDNDAVFIVPDDLLPGRYVHVQSVSRVGGWNRPTMRELRFEVLDCRGGVE